MKLTLTVVLLLTLTACGEPVKKTDTKYKHYSKVCLEGVSHWLRGHYGLSTEFDKVTGEIVRCEE